MLRNGDVYGPAGHTTFIGVRDKRIVTGTESDLIGDGTLVVDLAGRTVIVGLTDAHCHLYGLGVDLENVSVRNLPSEADAAKTIAEAAKTRPAGEWLIGRGWDQNKWPGQAFPTKASLDKAVSDRPVLLRRIDGHAAWLNSKALAASGITKATKDPAGGKIIRDKKGEPTGVLVDNAMDLVDAKVPAPTADTRERRILAAARIATQLGFTAVHEMGIDWDTVAAYEKLAREGRLPIRVYAYLSGDPKRAEELRTHPPAPPVGKFVMRGVKFFVDGALGSRGARLHEDYSDDKGNKGLWVTEPAQLAAAVDAAVAGGWQVAIHAIGDAGISTVLDAYEKYPAQKRLRIEHLQVVGAKDWQRLAKSGVIASMQPTHATSDMPWAEARVGAERIKGAYAWRTVLDNKIPLAFGSDFPVEEVDPLLGLHAAVTRTSPDGQPTGGWYPQQKLTLEEAIAAFTTGAAYAAGASSPNAFVDLTVFDGKLTEQNLLKHHVAATFVDGDWVYGEMSDLKIKLQGRGPAR